MNRRQNHPNRGRGLRWVAIAILVAVIVIFLFLMLQPDRRDGPPGLMTTPSNLRR